MIICIPENLKKTDSGKHKFLNRLKSCFEDKGIKVVSTGKDSDICLHIGKGYDIGRHKKKVMRLDGVNLNTSVNYNSMNKKLMKAVNQSDAVIYQSEFCKNAYTKFLGVRKENAVINNGADPHDYLDRNVQNYFLAHCKWRPHKRLKAITNAFIEACDNGLDSKLFITGDPDKKNIHDSIKYTGWIGDKELKRLFSEAIAQIHISWLDWCPNAVVESLVAGCPVIYADSGGTPEIVKGNGYKCNDKNWNYKEALDLYKPPHIDRQELIKGFSELKENNMEVDASYLHIDFIADKYIEFFEGIL